VYQANLYNVILRASLATDETSIDEYAGDDTDIGWFDEIPEGVNGDIEDDIRFFID
jgi:hypothetical protein